MDALADAIARLEARSNDPKAKLFKLSDDLTLIRSAFVELQRRTEVLASVALDRHYGHERLTGTNFDSIIALVPRGDHQDTCTCEDCMRACMTRLSEMARSL